MIQVDIIPCSIAAAAANNHPFVLVSRMARYAERLGILLCMLRRQYIYVVLRLSMGVVVVVGMIYEREREREREVCERLDWEWWRGDNAPAASVYASTVVVL